MKISIQETRDSINRSESLSRLINSHSTSDSVVYDKNCLLFVQIDLFTEHVIPKAWCQATLSTTINKLAMAKILFKCTIYVRVSGSFSTKLNSTFY